MRASLRRVIRIHALWAGSNRPRDEKKMGSPTGEPIRFIQSALRRVNQLPIMCQSLTDAGAVKVTVQSPNCVLSSQVKPSTTT